MWTLGGVLLITELVLFERVVESERGLWLLGTGAVAVGLAAWRARHALRLRVLSVGAFLGVAAVTAAVMFMGEASLTAGLALLYVWVAVFASLFLQPHTARWLIAFIIANHVLVVMRFRSLPATSPLVLATTLCLVTFVIERLHQARVASETDAATGTLNAVGLTRFLEQETEASPGSRAVAVIEIADATRPEAGHAAAWLEDVTAARLVDRWRRHVDDDDVLARLSINTFSAVLQAPTADFAMDRVRQLRASTSAHASRCSIGLAMHRPGEAAASVLWRAETALATARQSGIPTVVDDRDDPVTQELARAIERREFTLDWQPIIDLRAGRLTGFETLLRWQHPSRGRLGPDEFVPLAERTGLILPLGRWVLEEACAQTARWHRQFGLAALTVAVNVSGRQLDDHAFVDDVVTALQRHDLPASHLTIEVTESVVADDKERWLTRLHGLQALGVHLAMDDFGTGYSSLGHLRDLPFSTIKIDRSFVQDLARDCDADALITAVISMAAGLGKQVITEGVETPRQLAALRAHGCGRAQGYLLGRPMPARDAERLVARQTETSTRFRQNQVTRRP